MGGGSVTLKSKGALDDMSYYINTAMPAGVYVVTFYGDAAKDADGKSYDAITNSYEITVKPKEMDACTTMEKTTNRESRENVGENGAIR